MEWIVAAKLKDENWFWLYEAEPTLEVLQLKDPKRIDIGLKVSDEE